MWKVLRLHVSLEILTKWNIVVIAYTWATYNNLITSCIHGIYKRISNSDFVL